MPEKPAKAREEAADDRRVPPVDNQRHTKQVVHRAGCKCPVCAAGRKRQSDDA